MARAIQIRMGGYGPPKTTHNRALKRIGDRLEARLGDAVEVKYVWNIMDFGYRSEDILWLVEQGVLTLGYQSSSYLTDRVPELGFADLPFLFPTLEAARAAYDGAFGRRLAEAIEARCDYRILGWFENGYRHISNRVRPVTMPEHLAGMRIRVLPSAIHARAFELLGAEPLRWDLTEALDAIKAGTIDAQENPLANTVTYGAHKAHRFHTLSSHFYLSRPIFAHRAGLDAWPAAVRDALEEEVRAAVPYQRELAVEEETVARRAVEAEGCEIVELSGEGRAAFADAVRPLHAEARGLFGEDLFRFAAEAMEAA